ncbi:MAG: hypothetical protein AABY50_08875 [Nitrospirota bacterium]
MGTAIRDKHLKIDQRKIDRAKQILGLKTETETIEKALDIVIKKSAALAGRERVVKRILIRREKMKAIPGDVTDWIREAREERDKRYEF